MLNEPQECISTKSQGHGDIGLEAFKGQFCYVKFQTGYGSIGDDMAIEDIPKGGAYWMEDIMRGLKEVKINDVFG